MDQQQQQNVNRSAREWTEAVKNSFQTLAGRTVTLQESNLKLTQNFFQQFVEQLRGQMQSNQQDLETFQRQAFETLASESANAYSDFLSSALSFYEQALQQAAQVAQSNMQTAGQVTQGGIQAAGQGAQQSTQAAMQVAQQSTQAAIQIARSSVPKSAKQIARDNKEAAIQAAQTARADYQNTQAGQAAWQAVQDARRATRTVLEVRRSLLEVSGSGKMEEREAQTFSMDAVRRARAETERVIDAPAPSPEEVRARRAKMTVDHP